MSADKSPEHLAKSVRVNLTEEQKQAIAKVFGPEMAKKVEAVLIAQAGAGLQSMVYVN